ncbi:hypothetical protein GCM10012287_35700 [Streptomyces daqingensis]|uniref:Uncharacterized protein n=1 Tax=Streptomyces daqingensis TaxID=1472640 RepID=A0ABQ2MI02_9ACTN|nr:hypothetical protein [Streptomyces daqingensis]GGO52116.1 hypothetical protein GCM10012287_35700 [Streptomyces daqingensis]
MTYESDEYTPSQDPREAQSETSGQTSGIRLEDVSAGRDAFIAGRDNYIYYITGLEQLRPHPVARHSVLSERLFVQPRMRSTNPTPEPFSADSMSGPGVLVITSDGSSGRRTAALKQLDRWLPADRPIFELFPDWEQPEVSRIPCRPGVGYLLNLTGVQEPLDTSFFENLPDYAEKARSSGTCLVIIAGEHLSNGALAATSELATVPVLQLLRPPALDVALRRIANHPERHARTAWLREGESIFAGKLGGDQSPEEAVRFADIVIQSKGPEDTESLDRYLGWEHKLAQWFGGSDSDAPEKRAQQISAACLDGAPARVVLDAADALLASPSLNWPARVGGPLAGADDTQRCKAAEIDFAQDGTVSISASRPGISHALLRHLWRNRPQLVPVLSDWFSEISKPRGIAEGHLSRLAEVLTAVAATEGPDAVLELTQEWLRADRARYTDLAVDVLSRLAVNPATGSRVRRELSGWARGHTMPERQRAVVSVCRGALGRDYPSIALKRLEYVLDENTIPEVRQEAVASLRHMLADWELSARALKTIVEWVCAPQASERSGKMFLEIFDHTTATDSLAPIRGLLALEGTAGRSVRQLLSDGWRAVWRRVELRHQASHILDRWCEAADANELPPVAVEEIISVIFTEHADALGDDLDRVIGGSSPFRANLRTRFVEQVRESAARRSYGDTQQVA